MDNPPEALVALLGLDLPADRREAVLAAFATIAGEIAKLRSLGLTDVHPAVVFDIVPSSSTP